MSYKLLSKIYYSNNDEYENIYLSRINGESTLRFDFKIKRNPAFVVINNEIVQLLTTIYKKDKELYKLRDSLPGIALSQYARKCLIDEIKVTNEIEGVNSTRKEINDILLDKVNNKKRLYGLVKKYQLLMEEDIKLDTCQDIRNIYDELVLDEVINDDKDNTPDGEIFRIDGVSVLNESGDLIHRGITPEENIIKSLSSGLNLLKNKDINILISISVFHYLCGYVHPFYDGNGRLSRFISSYLISDEIDYLVSYRIAYTIKQNLKSYYKCFKISNDTKNKGELTYFVIFFLDIINKSLDDLIESINERIEKIDFYHEKIQILCENNDSKSSILFILVQDTLFGEGALSINDLIDITNIGRHKLRACLNFFDEVGVLNTRKESKKFIYSVDLDKLNEY